MYFEGLLEATAPMWPTHCVQQMVAALLHASCEAISPERHLAILPWSTALRKYGRQAWNSRVLNCGKIRFTCTARDSTREWRDKAGLGLL